MCNVAIPGNLYGMYLLLFSAPSVVSSEEFMNRKVVIVETPTYKNLSAKKIYACKRNGFKKYNLEVFFIA